jgi:hypothetical protein
MNDKKEQDVETHISATGFHDILQDLDFIFYLKVFSEVLPQAKKPYLNHANDK